MGYTRCFGHIVTLMRFLAAEPRSRRTYIPLTVSLSNDLDDSIRWSGTGGFKEQGQCRFIGLSCSLPLCLLFSSSVLSFYEFVLWVSDVRLCNVEYFFINYYNNNNNNMQIVDIL